MSTKSRILSYYWDDETPGLSSLLTRIGATTLAFGSLRRALLVEGASDAILYPMLVREVIEDDHLGYQLIPGLAEADVERLKAFGFEAARVAYLVDGDEGGRRLKSKLRKASVPEDLMFDYEDSSGNGLTIEDFIDRNVYIRAINEELRRSCGSKYEMCTDNFVNGEGNVRAVKKFCDEKGIRSPNKRAVAERVRENGVDDVRVVNFRRKKGLIKLHNKISERLRKGM